jgi:NADPH2:quinone reductase
LRVTRPEGRILTIGFASGTVPQIPANLLLVKNISVLGLYWGGYLKFAPEVLTGSLSEVMALYAAGRIKPHVGASYPLDRAAEALDLLRSRKSTGKVVVTM